MLILIAESKTMLDNPHEIRSDYLENHIPILEKQAGEIVSHLETMSQSELISVTGLSPLLASKLRQMIYEFPNKALGEKAIRAFTGVVFKALDYDSLTVDNQETCEKTVGIISSLYGILHPDDIIKPYRLDFTTKASPAGTALNTFWKKDVTIQIVKTVRDEGYGEILNLLPGDAAKCVDWKLIKRFAKVWKVDFVEPTEGGKTKAPAANKLKTMRGKLLRQILCENVDTIEKLKSIQSEDYLFEGTPIYPDHLQFVC